MKAMRMVCLMALLAATAPAYATVVEIDVVPNAWKVEDYVGGSPVVWYTTATPCNQGALTFPTSATASDIDRLWATVALARATQQQMFVRYDNTTCQIVSFGIYPGN